MKVSIYMQYKNKSNTWLSFENVLRCLLGDEEDGKGTRCRLPCGKDLKNDC